MTGGFYHGKDFDKPRQVCTGSRRTEEAWYLRKDLWKEGSGAVSYTHLAVIGAPVSYVTSVIDVKDTEYNRFVIT